jgi:hypothetical protein
MFLVEGDVGRPVLVSARAVPFDELFERIVRRTKSISLQVLGLFEQYVQISRICGHRDLLGRYAVFSSLLRDSDVRTDSMRPRRCPATRTNPCVTIRLPCLPIEIHTRTSLIV